MAILEITTRTTVYGESAVNRYHYMSTNNGTPYVPFSLAALDDVRTALQASYLALLATNVQVRLQDWKCRSLYDPTDFAEFLTVNLAGTAGAQEPIPPNWCLSARSNRMETGRRRAYKRVSGVGEVDVVGNGLSATAVTRWAAYSAALAEVVTVTFGIEPNVLLTPVILKYKKTLGVGGLPNTYAPYPTEVEQRASTMVPASWQWYQMTTQSSRRPGRGI